MIDFVGIGAQKCGTTWLFENMNRHDHILFPGGKEIHFWTLYYGHGIPWYTALFDIVSNDKKGEITPAYAILSIRKIKYSFRDLKQFNTHRAYLLNGCAATSVWVVAVMI